MPFEDKLDLLRQLLAAIDLQGACVLDAGSGRGSARAILERQPAEVTLVCAPGDELKAGHVREELERFPAVSGKLLQVDLADPGCLQEEAFDFILADYLISGLQWGKQGQVISNLHRWLRPGGQLLIVDVEPPDHTVEERWVASALLFWSRFVTVYNSEVVVEPTYYPQESVLSWLAAVGFCDLRVQQYDKPFDRHWALRCYERAVTLLPQIENEALRYGVQRELNVLKARVESWEGFAPPGIAWTKNYAIHARKR
jgi:SAM-dependent methyltransferase